MKGTKKAARRQWASGHWNATRSRLLASGYLDGLERADAEAPFLLRYRSHVLRRDEASQRGPYRTEALTPLTRDDAASAGQLRDDDDKLLFALGLRLAAQMDPEPEGRGSESL